jgi:hypothetical protein
MSSYVGPYQKNDLKKNHRTDEILKFIFLVDRPYFSKIKKYLFQGARPSYGATVL